MCQEIVREVEKKIIEPSTRGKIIEILKRQCNVVFKPNYERMCDQFVDQNIDKVMDIIKKEMSKDLGPTEVCGQLGACSKEDCKCLSRFLLLFLHAFHLAFSLV